MVEEKKEFKTPPWKLIKPMVLFDLANSKKAETSPEIFVSKFNEIVDNHKPYVHVFTDGSKMEDQVACAAIIDDLAISSRLPDKASIFSAELKAIELALKYIERDRQPRFIIFSDSKSVLEALLQARPDNPKVSRLVTLLDRLRSRLLKTILFCWLPSHIGISGNEAADRAAKAALEQPVHFCKLPASDFRCQVKAYINKKWQDHWDGQDRNKLHKIKPNLSPHNINCCCRRDEIVLTRLRLGHSHFTHSFLLKREDPPFCIGCHSDMTVKHILLDCLEYSVIQQNYYNVSSLKELFDRVSPGIIITFIKEIGLYRKM